ncbi:hypothetical protein ACS0TY_026364 [Phlomoides rotata]
MASTFYYCIKFPTSEGVVGTIKGDQKMAKRCLSYNCFDLLSAPRSVLALENTLVNNEPASSEPSNSIQTSNKATTETTVQPAQDIDDLEPRLGFEPTRIDIDPRGPIHGPRGQNQTIPTEELEHIPVDPARPELEVMIGSQIPPEMRGEMIDFLKSNIDIFAWSHEDMVGIDPKHACHRLKIDPKKRPVSQKRRKLGPDKYAALAGGLELDIAVGVKRLHIFMNSLFVVNQIKGEYEARGSR